MLLLGDNKFVKQIIGASSGIDLIPAQVVAVVGEWLRLEQRTWEQFLNALKKNEKYNHFRRDTEKNLQTKDIGIFTF